MKIQCNLSLFAFNLLRLRTMYKFAYKQAFCTSQKRCNWVLTEPALFHSHYVPGFTAATNNSNLIFDAHIMICKVLNRKKPEHSKLPNYFFLNIILPISGFPSELNSNGACVALGGRPLTKSLGFISIILKNIRTKLNILHVWSWRNQNSRSFKHTTVEMYKESSFCYTFGSP